MGYIILASVTISLIAWVTRHQVGGRLRNLLRIKGNSAATTFAVACVGPLVRDDRVALRTMLEDFRDQDPEVVYALILGPGEDVLGNTLPGPPSRELLEANAPRQGGGLSMRPLVADGTPLYDFAAPILGGRLGTLRIGFSLERVARTQRLLTWTMILVGIAAGAGGLTVLTFLATRALRPLEELTTAAQNITGGAVEAKIPRSGIAEVGRLAAAFREMTAQLCQQIRELRDSQSKIQHLMEYNDNLLNNMGDGICVVGNDLRIEYANATMRERLGASPGGFCHDILHPGDGACASCPLPIVLQRWKAVTRENETPDGRVYEVLYSPLRNADGTVSVLQRWRDVTDHKLLERQLALSMRMAAVGEIAAGVAHEINNPLDWTQSCLEMLKGKTSEDGELPTLLNLMEEGLSRMELIVRRLLSFSRKHEMRQEHFAIHDCIGRSFLFVKYRFERRCVAVEFDFTDELPDVRGDPDELSQVFVNLLLNALDAVGEGGEVRVRSRVLGQPPRAIEVEVTDNGCGIAPEDLPRIFQPFFTTKPPEKGTGLGLSISKTIVEEHGGRILVRSIPGQGSTFTLQIPAV